MKEITLTDVRSEAFDAIQKLKTGEIDISTAKEIRGLLDTIVNTAKSQVDFLNALPRNLKETMNVDQILDIAGSYKDRDVELDKSLKKINESNQKAYDLI